MTCKGHSIGIKESSEEEMAEIRRQAIEQGNATLEALEQIVYAADSNKMPVFDCTVVIGNQMLHHCKNQAFIAHVEQEVYKLIVDGGYCFERHPTGEVKFNVPKDAWALKIPGTMHLHPSRTCCGMYQVLVVIKEGDAGEINVPHDALVPYLYYENDEVTDDDEGEEGEEGDELSGEEEAREHMRSKEEWPPTGRPRIPTPPQRV